MSDPVVSFTGHRPDKLGGYDEANPIAEGVKDFLRSQIQLLKQRGSRTFISGMALGVDQWAAEIVLEDPELILVAAIPCKGQELRWSPEAQERYNKILAAAHHKHYIAEQYAPWVMQKRNEFMVDMSQIVVAIWDGSKGGTHNCVKYAKRKEKELIIFNPGAVSE